MRKGRIPPSHSHHVIPEHPLSFRAQRGISNVIPAKARIQSGWERDESPFAFTPCHSEHPPVIPKRSEESPPFATRKGARDAHTSFSRRRESRADGRGTRPPSQSVRGQGDARTGTGWENHSNHSSKLLLYPAGRYLEACVFSMLWFGRYLWTLPLPLHPQGCRWRTPVVLVNLVLPLPLHPQGCRWGRIAWHAFAFLPLPLHPQGCRW